MKQKTPDSVCGTAEKVKFKIAPLPEDSSYVLIEGDRNAFKFLARLFDAHAEADDCGFHIGPKCAGNAWFKKGSSLGLYLHKLPCGEKRSVPRGHSAKNVQVIDGADNATYSIFQATEEEFKQIFPRTGQDIEVVEDYVGRVGENESSQTLSKLWERPVHKREVKGIHGTLYYDYAGRSKYLPRSRREIDRTAGQLNKAERALYAKLRK
jgi:hypothetical protein